MIFMCTVLLARQIFPPDPFVREPKSDRRPGNMSGTSLNRIPLYDLPGCMRCKLVRRATAFIPDMCRLGRFIDELVSFALLGLGYGGTDGKAFRGQI
jgi:hypothetical protein